MPQWLIQFHILKPTIHQYQKGVNKYTKIKLQI
jgi:hypothetical protein